jgi:hypothetical protein
MSTKKKEKKSKLKVYETCLETKYSKLVERK